MITQVTRKNEAEYFRRLGQAPFFASVMHTVYASCEGRGVQCFLAGELAVLQVCGQRALLCGEPEDEAELASFLSFLGVARLKTQGCCPQGFAPHALPLLRFDVRRAPPVPPVPDGLRLENEPSLLAVRCIKGLSDGAVPPDSFAVDAAARRNRGLADIRALSSDGDACGYGGRVCPAALGGLHRRCGNGAGLPPPGLCRLPGEPAWPTPTHSGLYGFFVQRVWCPFTQSWALRATGFCATACAQLHEREAGAGAGPWQPF